MALLEIHSGDDYFPVNATVENADEAMAAVHLLGYTPTTCFGDLNADVFTVNIEELPDDLLNDLKAEALRQ